MHEPQDDLCREIKEAVEKVLSRWCGIEELLSNRAMRIPLGSITVLVHGPISSPEEFSWLKEPDPVFSTPTDPF